MNWQPLFLQPLCLRVHILFSAIIQKPKEKSNWVFCRMNQGDDILWDGYKNVITEALQIALGLMVSEKDKSMMSCLMSVSS